MTGAGRGNRTLANGLEGRGSTIELYPQLILAYGVMVPLARFERATFRLGGKRSIQLSYKGMVRMGRLELPRRKTPEPKSGASANFATFAIDIVYQKYKLRGKHCELRERL